MDRAELQLSTVTGVLRAADLVEEIHGLGDVSVSGVSQDSRQVNRGDLFLAWRGESSDAHDFVADAARAGAVAAVVERHVSGVEIPQVRVRDGRLAAALAADTVAGSPWKKMFIAAVTGTNGKTTTAALARHVLAAAGSAACVGSLGVLGPDGAVEPGSGGLTTPGPVQISETLRTLADRGVGHVVLEASSHALEQRRLDGVRFDAVAFTNLSQDHLDYHATIADYTRAKARLVDLRKSSGFTVVNRNEPAWSILGTQAAQTITYGSSNDAQLRGDEIELHAYGTRFKLVMDEESVEVDLPLLGDFNIENALAAAGIGHSAGLELGEIGSRLSSAPQVPGRLEVVATEPFRVLIDFAHTPDALERVLATLRPLVTGRLIVLFGAGGDRDPGKRPLMGRAVARGADLAIVTSDNPRTEDPHVIVDGVVSGMNGVAHEREVDRHRAIRLAIDTARDGDLVLLAGKGHETYQVVGTEKQPFDEAALVWAALAGRGNAS